jgi:hypothetical protein
MRPLFFTVFLILATAPCGRAAVDFVRDVRPIFETHCYECHGAEKQKNGFRLDVKREAFHSGDDHAPNLIPGDSAASPLFRFVTATDSKGQMPPKSKGNPLTPAQIATLKQWIDEGAPWPAEADTVKLPDKTDWWSFKPLVKPLVPEISNLQFQISNPIDAFIVAKLDEHHLPQSPVADPRTLIRRLTYDLTGLPPTPEAVETFSREFIEHPASNKRSPRLPPLRRALGAPLAGCRPLRRDPRLRQGQAPAQRLALSRLRHSRV